MNGANGLPGTIVDILSNEFRAQAAKLDIGINFTLMRHAGGEEVVWGPHMGGLPQASGDMEGPLHVEVWLERNGLRLWHRRYQMVHIDSAQDLWGDIFDVLYSGKFFTHSFFTNSRKHWNLIDPTDILQAGILPFNKKIVQIQIYSFICT